MLFNSLQFGVFFLIVAVLYWTLRSQKLRRLLLLAASYFFYATFDWRFLVLLLISTAVDFAAARSISRARTSSGRRAPLMASIVANLGILGIFKYFDFFVDSAQRLLDTLGLSVSPPVLGIAVPVGLSFYTFQSMSYTIDVYRGKFTAEEDPIVFATYVAFFPQLAAGPIERAGDLIPQLRSLPGRLDVSWLVTGLDLVVLGLFRKVALADVMAPVVRRSLSPVDAAGAPVDVSWVLAWTGVLAFMVQLYGDFSGYSTIARGLAKMLGIDISRNFRRPLWATSQDEFWRRWHVTLMNWFRDYVYYPLWRRRYRRLRLRGWSRMAFALLITFTLSGLWHGASWALVVWGFAAGVLLLSDYRVRRWLRRRSPGSGSPTGGEAVLVVGDPRGEVLAGERGSTQPGNSWGRGILDAANVAVTILPLAVLTVLLPLRSLTDAGRVWWSILTFGEGVTDGAAMLAVAWGLAGLVLGDQHEWRTEAVEDGVLRRGPTSWLWWGVRVGVMVCAVMVFSGGPSEPYFYFQF